MIPGDHTYTRDWLTQNESTPMRHLTPRLFRKLLALLAVLPAVCCADQPGEVQLENLRRAALHDVEGMEVIMHRVTLPPHVELPRHWHPGQEFGYVLEGEVTLWLEGQADSLHRAGEAVEIPVGAVHTAITGDQGATLLVFRVHPAGEPERVLSDEGESP